MKTGTRGWGYTIVAHAMRDRASFARMSDFFVAKVKDTAHALKRVGSRFLLCLYWSTVELSVLTISCCARLRPYGLGS